MRVKILYFGAVGALLDRRDETLTVADGTTVRGLLETLHDRHPLLRRVTAAVKVAVNETFPEDDEVLHDGTEVALLPPVAGGATDAWCRLVDEPLRLDEVMSAVSGLAQGAVSVFVGLVRDQNEGRQVVGLEYEAYTSMALTALADIVRRCESAAPGVRVAVAHRVGALEVGEAAVMIAASAPHRAEAMQACRRCIELIKREVPIWKKETTPEGHVWVGTRP